MDKTRRLSGRMMLALGGFAAAAMLAMSFGARIAAPEDAVAPPVHASTGKVVPVVFSR